LIIPKMTSHVPCTSLSQGHATYTPDAIRTVNRFPPYLSQHDKGTLVLTSLYFLTRPHQWFICIRLPETHLTLLQRLSPCCSRPFLLRYSRTWWFKARTCIPALAGL